MTIHLANNSEQGRQSAALFFAQTAAARAGRTQLRNEEAI